MEAVFGAEHEELRSAIRRFLERKSPESEVRRLMETTAGYDPAVWSQMADQLGLQGLIIPEQFGGSGYGYVELIVVLEEMGRALLCAPYFSSVVMAANLLIASGDDGAKKDYLPGIASGSVIATVALAEADGRWDEACVTLRADCRGGDWTLTGEKLFVFNGVTADVVLAVARTPAVCPSSRWSKGRPACPPARCPPWTRPASRPGWPLTPPRPA